MRFARGQYCTIVEERNAALRRVRHRATIAADESICSCHEEPNHRLNPLRSAPNLLTLLRICLAPFLVAAILEGHFLLSFLLFVAAGLTDALDGTLARVLKQRSMLGHYLDPVADKLLLSTLFLVLMYKGLMPVTVTVLVFGRDVGILLVSALLYAAVGRREFHPSIFGKANTLAQICRGCGSAAAPAHGSLLGSRFSHSGARRHHRADVSLACITHGSSRAVRRGSSQRRRRKTIVAAQLRLGVVRKIFRSSRVFNLHIAKLFGIEDLATLQALDILGVVVPGNDPDLGVSAGGCHRSQGLLNLQQFQS